MKILRLRAYYDPEKTAGIHLDHDLCEAFMNNGIHYISYTPSPTRGVSKEVREEYKSKRRETLYNGFVTINRFPMFREGHNPIQRAIRYATCSIKEYQLGIKEKEIDLIYSSSTPPTQGMLSALVAKKLSKKYKRKVPFVYNLQDIFPDSLVNAKMSKKGSLIWKLGRKIEDFTYRNADKIIVISEGFKQNIMEKGVPEDKIVVIPNWVDTEKVYPVCKEDNRLFEEFGIDRKKFIVVYAGNFGAMQGTDVILQAAELLKDSTDIQFVLFGGGAEYQKAVDTVQDKQLNNVIINKLLPQDRVSEVYSLGDVALITCKKGVGGSGLPSKTWSIMACNTPIIAAFDTDSELADILLCSGAGFCVEPENVKALTNAISSMYKIWANNVRKESDLRGYVINNASKSLCTGKYVETICSCLNKTNA